MAKTRKYSKRKHHKKKAVKRSRSRRGSGIGRRQAGGQAVFVGAPFNGADTNTWGVTNHYAYNPEGSGSLQIHEIHAVHEPSSHVAKGL